MLQCFRFHIDQGRGNKIAIIYDSPITGVQKKITYNELKDEVALFAGALKKQGELTKEIE